MTEQIDYYNRFGEQNRSDILSCPEPHLWTTDYKEKGRIYHEMEERIKAQEYLVEKYFDRKFPVLDVGCGFGRQAYLLAKKGFKVVGTDTSKVFIDIANDLFRKNQYDGKFLCADIMKMQIEGSFKQILLLDVLEHVPPAQRNAFIKQLSNLTGVGGILIVSLPHIKKRLSSQINNRFRKAITQHFSFFKNHEEHPYPIPQKTEIIKLTSKYYIVTRFQESRESDYYIFEKR